MPYAKGEPFVQAFFDANGDPLVNGTVEFYIWNTSTPTAVYSDASGTSAGTSVTLDSNGAPSNSGTPIDLYFDVSVVYKIIRKDSAGTPIAPTIGPYYGAGVGGGYVALSIDAVDSGASDSLYDYIGVEDGQQVTVAGYYTPGDGGGGTFWWDSGSSDTDDGGLVILPTGHATAGRWRRLPQPYYKASQFGGATGVQNTDTAAVQAMIDAGLEQCWLDAGVEHELLGLVVPQGQQFYLRGESARTTSVAVRGKVITYGTIGTVSDPVGEIADGITFNIYADCMDGVIDLKYCRNWRIGRVMVSDGDNTTHMGFFVNCDRSYQGAFDGTYGRWHGGALFEIGVSSGSEVLDTISLNNTVWHGNYGIFQRSGFSQMHNLVLNNAKFRAKGSSDEETNSNQGETYLTAAATAGATSITVNSAAALNGGNLAVGDFLYVGHGLTAEQLRVSSVNSNTITFDTQLRFSHSADLNSTGFGDPVIFGPVFITTGFIYSVSIPALHIESGYIGVHSAGIRGLQAANVFSTCKNTFRALDKSRSWDIDVVTMGSVGWSGSVYLVDVPQYHGTTNTINNILVNNAVQADAGVTIGYINNDSAQETNAFMDYKGNATHDVFRSLTTTINPTLISEAIIEMTGRIDTLTIIDGILDGQKLSIIFKQDSNGHRYVTAFSANVSLDSTLYLSSKPEASDRLELYWDATAGAWVEASRVISDIAGIPHSRASGFIGTATDDVNTINKYARKPLLNSTTNQILYASGSNATDAWLDSDGTTVITPS